MPQSSPIVKRLDRLAAGPGNADDLRIWFFGDRRISKRYLELASFARFLMQRYASYSDSLSTQSRTSELIVSSSANTASGTRGLPLRAPNVRSTRRATCLAQWGWTRKTSHFPKQSLPDTFHFRILFLSRRALSFLILALTVSLSVDAD